MKQLLKDHATGTAGLLIGFLMGLLLLFVPQLTAKVVVLVIGGALILFGVVRMIQYFRADAHAAVDSWGLATGVMVALGGVGVFVFSKALIGLVPFVIGCIIIAGGVLKLQRALDLMRLGAERWYLDFIGVAVSIVLGLIIILNPFATALTLMRVIGASLVVEAVQDALCELRFYKIHKRF